ncbi:hypothetical protein SASPL_131236 [Salvia splendens]|uniref:Trichome birefringence-like N-terminal domain-containing protein n=1 Tax=Salvia splendens TaxID=180675 RepID=A0A8X8X8D7_SALSN|nr:hypothetical protein SASPL_131236 [Salvia splendens]
MGVRRLLPSLRLLIDDQFNCLKYRRPDRNYLKYRWQPFSCNLARCITLFQQFKDVVLGGTHRWKNASRRLRLRSWSLGFDVDLFLQNRRLHL